MNSPKDDIYAESVDNVSPFVFDDRVASVFADMISRSVPSYAPILKMLPTITRGFRMPEARYYDLGCSLGAGLHAMAEGLKISPEHPDIQATLVGIDNSEAMLARAKDYGCLYDNLKVEFRMEDLAQSRIENAAMVLMNFTLQFLPLESRAPLVHRIYEGLNPGGALILSEKISFKHERTNKALIDIHHRYKADQGYSQLEISQKRDAIENVLIPETLNTHLSRLRGAGFEVVTPWMQNLQFLSILAIK